MGYAKLLSRAQLGIDAPQVWIEAHLSGGLPSFSIVGLAEAAVRESRERVRSALLNSGFDYPQSRITINLAPADLPKGGGRYDLAIALGILIASKQVSRIDLKDTEIYGELGLDGALKAVSGLFPAARCCADLKRSLIAPRGNEEEIACAGVSEMLAADSLGGLVQRLSARPLLMDPLQEPEVVSNRHAAFDMNQVNGQIQGRRAIEIAASGGHNLLFTGPPGSGKTLLASCIPGLLPPLTYRERVDAAAVHSVAGLPITSFFAGQHAFRSPHHSASSAAMVGGGTHPRPGEISLAHKGVLFLDELPEFNRPVLEALREPLETGEIFVSRASGTLRFPADFLLIAARNPCPCGYFDDGTERCQCARSQVDRYQNRVSGPLLDRFDLRLNLQALSPDEILSNSGAQESSSSVAARVQKAREHQLKRQGRLNARLSNQVLSQMVQENSEIRAVISQLVERLSLSARGCHRLLRVARTLADLAQREKILPSDLMEAASYRQ